MVSDWAVVAIQQKLVGVARPDARWSWVVAISRWRRAPRVWMVSSWMAG